MSRPSRERESAVMHRAKFAQNGLVLISSLLLLLIITILAMSMFRSFGIQEKIAGNVREKQRATHAAESAQQYAEWWLASGSNSATTPVACVSPLLNANLNQMQVCSNKFPAALDSGSVTTLPWQIDSKAVGTTYTPPGMNVGDTTKPDEYAQAPSFYISDLGPSADGLGELFQIDAVGYGGGAGTAVSVIESTYEVSSGVVNRGGP